MHLLNIIFFFKQEGAKPGVFLLEEDMHISYSGLNTGNLILILFMPM